MLFDDFKNFKNNTAIIDDTDINISYGELFSYSDIFFSKLEKRSVIFCLCENSIGSVIGYVSFIKNNIVPFLLDSKINKSLLIDLLDIYKPLYIWLPTKLRDNLNYYELIFEFYNYSLILLNNAKYNINDDLALLLSTSGSTGSNKLVRQSYKNIISNTESIIKYLDLTQNEKPITTLPMSYTYGLSIINSHLSVGATILVTSKTLMSKEFWNFFKEQGATSFGGVPYTYEILKKLRFFSMDLPSLKTMTQAGGKLSIELTKEFAEYAVSKNIKFFVMYGQTEATARMSYLPPKYSISKCGSVGIAIPNGKFNLIDDSGYEIKTPNTIGELTYKGDNVTLGYAENIEDLDKEDENRGILLTGDMAKFDEDGFYYITGRKKRFIKLFGNRINLDEIEQLIKPIVDNACSGVDDHMIIYITNTEEINNVKKLIIEKTMINSIAFEIKYISEIPKTISGKINYTLL